MEGILTSRPPGTRGECRPLGAAFTTCNPIYERRESVGIGRLISSVRNLVYLFDLSSRTFEDSYGCTSCLPRGRHYEDVLDRS